MGVAEKVRNELGASQLSASFLRDVTELLQVSRKKAARSMFGRTNFASKWQRWCICLGAQLRRELHEDGFASAESASAVSAGRKCVGRKCGSKSALGAQLRRQ